MTVNSFDQSTQFIYFFERTALFLHRDSGMVKGTVKHLF